MNLLIINLFNFYLMQEFDTFQSESLDIENQKTQLELYLDAPRVDRNSKIDVLNFWKAEQFRYPQVAAMARDVLAIPISTVASESAFSMGGRILDQYRSCLKPEVVEALLCNKNWIMNLKGKVCFIYSNNLIFIQLLI